MVLSRQQAINQPRKYFSEQNTSGTKILSSLFDLDEAHRCFSEMFLPRYLTKHLPFNNNLTLIIVADLTHDLWLILYKVSLFVSEFPLSERLVVDHS